MIRKKEEKPNGPVNLAGPDGKEDPYVEGQKDLIMRIKSDISSLSENSSKEDFIFDVLAILIKLKPKTKEEHDKSHIK